LNRPRASRPELRYDSPMRTLLLLILAGAALAGEADVESLRKRLKSEDPGVRAAAAEALGDAEGEEASKLLAGAVRDRAEPVRRAALKALGGRTDEIALRTLRRALRTFEKNEDLLAVTVVSLGDSEDAESADAIVDLLRRSTGKSARLSRNCIEALGRMRAKVSLEVLMDYYSQATDPRGAVHPELTSELLDSLRMLTGLSFSGPETWKRWWLKAKKRWEPTSLEPDPDSTVYRHDGWRFRIERPEGDRWVFERGGDTIVRARFAGSREEAKFARISVFGHATREGAPEDLAAAVKRQQRQMARNRSANAETEWAKRTKLGPHGAILHRVTDLDAGSVFRWRRYLLEKNGLIYTVEVYEESGASEAVRDELESILDSFRLLD